MVIAISLAARALLRPAGSTRLTIRSTTSATAWSSYAASSDWCTDPSNASSGSIQSVRSPASRIAFSAYAWTRSREIGHAPTTACQSRLASPLSGIGASRCSSVIADAHSSGTSASAVIRARVSSLRLVSWVVSAVIASGHSCWRREAQPWKCAGSTEKLRRVAADLVERAQPDPAVERVVLHTLGHHHAAGLLEAQRGGMGGVVQHRLQHVVRRRQVGPAPPCVGEGTVEVLDAVREVGPVDGEACHQLGDRRFVSACLSCDTPASRAAGFPARQPACGRGRARGSPLRYRARPQASAHLRGRSSTRSIQPSAS